MKKLPLTITFQKKDGKLIIKTVADKLRFDDFVKNCEEGEILEATLEEQNDDGTYAQLCKLHACIDALSDYTGYSTAELKKMIKLKADLVTDKEELVSFGDCNKAQLSLAINAVLEIGQIVGFPLE